MAQDWIGYAWATDSIWVGVLTPKQIKFNVKPLTNQSGAPSLRWGNHKLSTHAFDKEAGH